MMDVTNDLTPHDLDVIIEDLDICPSLKPQVFRKGSAHHAAFIEDNTICLKAIGFAPSMTEVTSAVRSSDPPAAFDCKTNAMAGILDDAPIQWFRDGDAHFAAFVRDGTIEMHECHLSYDQDRIAA